MEGAASLTSEDEAAPVGGLPSRTSLQSLFPLTRSVSSQLDDELAGQGEGAAAALGLRFVEVERAVVAL